MFVACCSCPILEKMNKKKHQKIDILNEHVFVLLTTEVEFTLRRAVQSGK